MIDPELLLAVVIFALTATVSPGGATTLATASGIQFGIRRSVPLLTGVACGLGVLVAVAAAGLGGLMQTYAGVQVALEAGGAAYLLWLAWKIGTSPAHDTAGGNTIAPISFTGAVLLLWANPKAWSMSLAAAASYSAVANSAALLAITLGLVFAIAAACSMSIWCIAGQAFTKVLRSAWHWRLVNCILATVLACTTVPMWTNVFRQLGNAS